MGAVTMRLVLQVLSRWLVSLCRLEISYCRQHGAERVALIVNQLAMFWTRNSLRLAGCFEHLVRSFWIENPVLGEESFDWQIISWRAIAMRYEKHVANYLALVKLAATRIWLRSYEPVA